MRKLILMFALSLSFVLNAAPINGEVSTKDFDELEALYSTEVNTFCKLITKGDLDAVQSMIVAGTDINEKSKGMTPLMYAARYNKVEIVELLIKHGADLKMKSNRGYTALEYAKMSKAHLTHKIIADALATQKLERKQRRKNRRKA